MKNYQDWLSNNFGVHFIFLIIFVMAWSSPVPSKNEFLYLLLPQKVMNPSFLLNDWFFSIVDRSHYIFNLFVAPFTLALPIDILGWGGRIFCWILTIIGLLCIGEKFLIPLWMVSLSIILWLVYGQSIVAGGWIIYSFEAKCIAYVCLLFSINTFLIKKDLLASILLGLTFSFHPSVGMFAILSFGLTLIAIRYPLNSLLKFVVLTFLFSLPGLIPLTQTVFAGAGLSMQDAKFLALIHQPFHMDPLQFEKRSILTLYILLLFNLLYFKENKSKLVFKLLTWFELFLCMFFTIGIACRSAKIYSFLVILPFRLFPIFTPFFFFLRLMHAYHYRKTISFSPAILLIGFVSLLCLNNPFAALADQVRHKHYSWKISNKNLKDNNITQTFKWISQNTPEGSVAILPPWRPDSWYTTNRAQIACWHYFPYDHRYAQWRERIESLIGKIDSRPSYDQMEARYNSLTSIGIDSVIKKYGGDYLVSKAKYSFPVLFDSGTYKIYLLKRV